MEPEFDMVYIYAMCIVPILSNCRWTVFHLYHKQPYSVGPARDILLAVVSKDFCIAEITKWLEVWTLTATRVGPRGRELTGRAGCGWLEDFANL